MQHERKFKQKHLHSGSQLFLHSLQQTQKDSTTGIERHLQTLRHHICNKPPGGILWQRAEQIRLPRFGGCTFEFAFHLKKF